MEAVDRTTFDLSVKQPERPRGGAAARAEEILDEIAALDAESAEILAAIREMV